MTLPGVQIKTKVKFHLFRNTRTPHHNALLLNSSSSRSKSSVLEDPTNVQSLNNGIALLSNQLIKFGQTLNHVNENETKKESHVLKKEKERGQSSRRMAVEEWVIDMQHKLELVSPHEGGHSIFKVPRSLLQLEPNSFIPQVVSIGPHHRGKAHLLEMEKHKLRLLRHVLERTGHPLELYFSIMHQMELRTRKCYEKSHKSLSSREFVEMMLLDACFILELLNVSFNGFEHCGYTADDPIFTSQGVSPFIQRDLLMLENQLPFFVFNRLYAFTWNQLTADESVSDLAVNFFISVIPGLYQNLDTSKKPLHLLDIVRRALQPCHEQEELVKNDSANSMNSHHKSLSIRNQIRRRQTQIAMQSVTKLRGAGITFVKKESENFMEIEFKKGVLHIPPLILHDSTKPIFLNLMAFEQCYPHCSNHVTSYVSFMDGLINSSKDVEYLRDKGIIEHGFGSEEEVAHLINNLRKEIVFDTNDYYLAEVSHRLHAHFNKKWHTTKTTLRHEYLKDPWKVISLVAASLLIFLTLTQTTYSTLSFHHPNNKQ